MPSYEYTCPLCQQKQTITASINDEIKNPTCPNCKIETHRVYTSAPIHFKGNGWAGKK